LSQTLTSRYVVFPRVAFVAALLTLALDGGVGAVYGTLLTSIAHHFDVSVPTAGIILTMNFVGGIAGAVAAWWSMRLMSGRWVLAASLALLGFGLVGLATVNKWTVFEGAAVLTGIGFGALDLAVYALLSRVEPTVRSWHLSVVGSGWGIGAVVAPLAIVILQARHFIEFFYGAAIVAFVLIVPTLRLVAPRDENPAVLGMSRPAAKVLGLFGIALFFYVSLETSISGWAASQLTAWHYSSSWAEITSAGFWAGVAFGRLLAPRWSHRLGDARVVIAGIIIASVLVPFASLRILAPVTYPVVGVCLSIVFPLALGWYNHVSSAPENGVAFLLLVTMVGGAVGPGVESLFVAHYGYGAVAWVADGFAALCAVTCVVIAALLPRMATSIGRG